MSVTQKTYTQKQVDLIVARALRKQKCQIIGMIESVQYCSFFPGKHLQEVFNSLGLAIEEGEYTEIVTFFADSLEEGL